jgi:hypothetical protein
MTNTSARPGLHAFAFQTGAWRVSHRKLKDRLAGSTEWTEFEGTCSAWELLDGAGNVDDYFMDDPSGAYHATTVRCLAPTEDKWSIWWFDGRSPRLLPPVHGNFQNNVGTFLGDDMLGDRPIVVRFLWTLVSPSHAMWEQAFSPDRGATWETNWTMRFDRAA